MALFGEASSSSASSPASNMSEKKEPTNPEILTVETKSFRTIEEK
jgi:hypothetical protein